jgi:hypothetical protein
MELDLLQLSEMEVRHRADETTTRRDRPESDNKSGHSVRMSVLE